MYHQYAFQSLPLVNSDQFPQETEVTTEARGGGGGGGIMTDACVCRIAPYFSAARYMIPPPPLAHLSRRLMGELI